MESGKERQPAPRQPASPGERSFADYLVQRDLRFDYEAPVGPRNPDFTVHHPTGDLVCEIYEPTIKLPRGGGAFSSYPQLRNAFDKRKYKQADAANEAGLPYVVVLASTNSDIPIDPTLLMGAMFGNLAIQIPLRPLGEEGPEPRAQGVFAGGGRLQSGMNRSVSAAAKVSVFNPTLWIVERALSERLPRDRPPAELTQDALLRDIKIIQDTYGEFQESGGYDESATLARVVVLHNPFAHIGLSQQIFVGPHDEQRAALTEDPTQYGIIFSGSRGYEVPGTGPLTKNP